jgi:hypothetical protein
MESFNWKCPYCKTQTTIVVDSNTSSNVHYYVSSSKYGLVGLYSQFIVCPNPNCKELIIKAHLSNAMRNGTGGYYINQAEIPLLSWDLKPQSSAIPQPDYIPDQIKNDYYEACSILSLSPKASATLSRRCLQGMIRDFWGITKNRLIDEINELKNQTKINASTLDSIDAIRQIGNIGAHMEKDVNLIVDIDEDEAGLLINLIEDLFQDWYVNKHEQEERSQKIKQLAQEKKAAKTGTP